MVSNAALSSPRPIPPLAKKGARGKRLQPADRFEGEEAQERLGGGGKRRSVGIGSLVHGQVG